MVLCRVHSMTVLPILERPADFLTFNHYRCAAPEHMKERSRSYVNVGTIVVNTALGEIYSKPCSARSSFPPDMYY